MSNRLSQKDLVDYLAHRYGVPKSRGQQLIHGICDWVVLQLIEGEYVTLPRLGCISLEVDTNSRRGKKFFLKFRPSAFVRRLLTGFYPLSEHTSTEEIIDGF